MSLQAREGKGASGCDNSAQQQGGTFSASSPGNHTSIRSVSGTTWMDMGLGADDEDEDEEEQEEEEEEEEEEDDDDDQDVDDDHSRAGVASSSDDGSQV